MFEGTYLLILIAGFGGGEIRGLVGFTKHQYKFKNVGFNLPYFIGMMFISGVVGLLTAIAFNESGISIKGIGVINPGIAFIIGYAGGDFIENVYKIINKKTNLYLEIFLF